ncbi:alpha/beta hydrolase [Sphingomonas sp. S1-29]|uniref:alpha/beta fold hydrolase n=1 Tax=Sphingomonas sp. S1-29 TaxID=2991074 RepID=UPI0022400612|nr:alpha/beta hydrolase [Sphingomonas sp. S1-29]UZK70434.1 alpha/beta hydrolase [Sphingomonas sp. S1-29]
MSIRPPRPARRFALATGALAAVAVVAAAYTAALRRAERRLARASEVIATRFGTLEYAVRGQGPPILMVHGTGGGFDQGLSFGAGLRQRGYQIIAPSRFGYLRSDYPAVPSSANQADTFVALLDHLGIDRLPVVGGSAGALSAVAFALRHPERCSLLILLVPAANVSGRDPVEMTALQQLLVERVLGSDFAYWSARTVAPKRLIGTLLATDPALLDRVEPGERARAYRILDEMLPVSARVRGIRNDARRASAPGAVAYRDIAVPTLIVSVEDDRFGTAATARYLAATIRDSRLVILLRGGHIWLGADDAVAEHVVRFISEQGAEPRLHSPRQSAAPMTDRSWPLAPILRQSPSDPTTRRD